jgi:Protein tyrosine/serine phosphatase
MLRRMPNIRVGNMRDLGGYSTESGKTILYNRFIRSNLPSGMTRSEIDYLYKNNIRTIIDLRSEEELKIVKSELDKMKFNYHHISLTGFLIPEEEKEIPKMYMTIVNDKEKMREIFEVILNSESGILFHCTAGKDRTGVLAMVLMLIAGCYEEDIIADYSLSGVYLKKIIKEITKKYKGLPIFITETKMEYMEETLKLFYKKYKTANIYMNLMGFTNKDFQNIKNRLLKEQ